MRLAMTRAMTSAKKSVTPSAVRTPSHPAHAAGHNRPLGAELHPVVNRALLALVLWLVLASWIFFGGGDYVGLLLAVVTGFFIIFVGVPAMLLLTWRRNHPDAVNRAAHPPFREWAAGDFDTWPGRIGGKEAAVEVLLPVAAVAFGMAAIGIVLTIVAHGMA